MTHEDYMRRCFDLAKLGAGTVAPNPMVGAVLVYNERIIGEGYHQVYGQTHAEVNCISNVLSHDRHLISSSTLYVSLEPCAHFGKTPPCADLVIREKIPMVVIGCRDSYKEVAGRGIQKMEEAGIRVITGVLEDEAIRLNRRFFTFHQKQRPYIILKWAQTVDKKIANADHSRLLISNDNTNMLVHKWRSEEAAILVGTNTALFDDPSLTTRHWKGRNPIRLVIDKHLRLRTTLRLFDGTVRTIVFNTIKHEDGDILYYQLHHEENFIQEMMDALFKLNIQSVLVEGGAALLQSFIDTGCWDEARVITNQQLIINTGVDAPVLKSSELRHTQQLLTDSIQYFKTITIQP